MSGSRVIQSPLWVYLALLMTVGGCAGSSQGDRVGDLDKRVADQEVRLTRLNQTVSADQSKIDYLQTQVEHAAGQGGDETARREEIGRSEIHFDHDRYDLSDEGKRSIDQLAEKLASDSRATIEIKGFTDGVGSREYNYTLGERRAETVARYLNTRHGVPLYRMERLSFGKDAAGHGDQDDPASRRVEMRVLTGKSRPGSPSLP